MTDKNEVLELAKKCGAKVFQNGDEIHIVVADTGSSGNATQFVPAFAAALEAKHQKQIAQMVSEVKTNCTEFHEDKMRAEDALKNIECAFSITQQSADAFVARVRAEARKEYREELFPLMVTRFLNWKLPKDFHPDAGISFEPEYNKEYMASLGKPPMCHEPFGTNLFDAQQTKGMVTFMLGGISDEQVDDAIGKLKAAFGRAAELRNSAAQPEGKENVK